MGSVGERLRRERLKSGLDLDRVSRQTKIPARLLEAIEQDEFEKVPGRVFLYSFVRQYAQTLGLDEAEFLEQLRAQLEPPPPPPAPVRETPRPWPRQTQVRLMLGGAAVVFLAFVLANTWPGSGSAPPPPAQPQRVSADSLGSADRLAPPTTAAAEQPAAPVEQPPLPAEQPPLPVEQPPLPVEQPPLAPAASSGLRLVLTAKKRTWVTAKQDGRSAFSGTLQPNEGRVLEGGSTIDVVIGNPEAVEVSLNGKPLEITGPPGDVAEVRIAAPDAPPVISHRHPLADLY